MRSQTPRCELGLSDILAHLLDNISNPSAVLTFALELLIKAGFADLHLSNVGILPRDVWWHCLCCSVIECHPSAHPQCTPTDLRFSTVQCMDVNHLNCILFDFGGIFFPDLRLIYFHFFFLFHARQSVNVSCALPSYPDSSGFLNWKLFVLLPVNNRWGSKAEFVSSP